MPRARANGVELEYETFGSSDDDPLLMIMGLGAQMQFWDDEFCTALATRKHYVIRFDNRDVGLSTWFDEAGTPDIMQVVKGMAQGKPVTTPYGLNDMADDCAGLLDALEIADAHICGASMGGMIAQVVAIRHPERTRTLTSIMSTTGNPALPGPSPEVASSLVDTPPTDREANLDRAVEMSKLVGSPGFPFDEIRIRERAGKMFDRAFHPEGTTRQFAAVLGHGSRADALKKLQVPALVIHGNDDALVSVEGGIDTAACIEGSTLMRIDGMGHDIPPELWDSIADAITQHTLRRD